MLSRHDAAAPGDLLLGVETSLNTLRSFVVERGLAASRHDWSEVVRTFSDSRAFVDFSAHRASGRPRVLIEFGMQDQGERRTLGFFDAFWDAEQNDFLRIEAAALEGAQVDVDVVVRSLMPYMSLPLAATSSSEMNTEG